MRAKLITFVSVYMGILFAILAYFFLFMNHVPTAQPHYQFAVILNDLIGVVLFLIGIAFVGAAYQSWRE